jgi:hypothetical protein
MNRKKLAKYYWIRRDALYKFKHFVLNEWLRHAPARIEEIQVEKISGYPYLLVKSFPHSFHIPPTEVADDINISDRLPNGTNTVKELIDMETYQDRTPSDPIKHEPRDGPLREQEALETLSVYGSPNFHLDPTFITLWEQPTFVGWPQLAGGSPRHNGRVHEPHLGADKTTPTHQFTTGEIVAVDELKQTRAEIIDTHYIWNGYTNEQITAYDLQTVPQHTHDTARHTQPTTTNQTPQPDLTSIKETRISPLEQ